jgi:hypothetical protein
MKACHHPGEDVDCKRQPEAALDWLTGDFIDKNNINLRMVDLHNSRGRVVTYSPGMARVALMPCVSRRLSARTCRSMASTRALTVRLSGAGQPFAANRA